MEPKFFDRAANDASAWIASARALFAAARCVNTAKDEAWPRGQTSAKLPAICMTFFVTPMLAGFGIECLLKAFWVAKGNMMAENGKCVSIPAKGKQYHELTPIANYVGFQVSPKEEEILGRLSAICKGAGRYPLPMRASEPYADSTGWSGWDDECIDKLITRLTEDLGKLLNQSISYD